MKYFILLSSFLLFIQPVQAEFVRKQKRPAYFIPEVEFQRKEIIPTPVKNTTQNRNINSNNHITRQNNKYQNSVKQQKEVPQKETSQKAEEQPKTYSNKENTEFSIPQYQQIYDIYHQDMLKFKKTRHLPHNQALENDLNKSSKNRFIVN